MGLQHPGRSFSSLSVSSPCYANLKASSAPSSWWWGPHDTDGLLHAVLHPSLNRQHYALLHCRSSRASPPVTESSRVCMVSPQAGLLVASHIRTSGGGSGCEACLLCALPRTRERLADVQAAPSTLEPWRLPCCLPPGTQPQRTQRPSIHIPCPAACHLSAWKTPPSTTHRECHPHPCSPSPSPHPCRASPADFLGRQPGDILPLGRPREPRALGPGTLPGLNGRLVLPCPEPSAHSSTLSHT